MTDPEQFQDFLSLTTRELFHLVRLHGGSEKVRQLLDAPEQLRVVNTQELVTAVQINPMSNDNMIEELTKTFKIKKEEFKTEINNFEFSTIQPRTIHVLPLSTREILNCETQEYSYNIFSEARNNFAEYELTSFSFVEALQVAVNIKSENNSWVRIPLENLTTPQQLRFLRIGPKEDKNPMNLAKKNNICRPESIFFFKVNKT